ncbi:MAG: hypothetical protein ABIQ65_00845, partial [Thermoanaerobaculia bacterium]
MGQTLGTRAGTRLCLNMIVKDEAAILERCLSAAAPELDYWVICDTGSSDGTQELVRSFFASRGIPGELHEIPFVDFSESRNRALSLCREAGPFFDYILLADADMELVVEDPGYRSGLNAGAHLVPQRNTITYENVRLLRRELPAHYVGATHEYIAAWATFPASWLAVSTPTAHAPRGPSLSRDSPGTTAKQATPTRASPSASSESEFRSRKRIGSSSSTTP